MPKWVRNSIFFPFFFSVVKRKMKGSCSLYHSVVMIFSRCPSSSSSLPPQQWFSPSLLSLAIITNQSTQSAVYLKVDSHDVTCSEEVISDDVFGVKVGFLSNSCVRNPSEMKRITMWPLLFISTLSCIIQDQPQVSCSLFLLFPPSTHRKHVDEGYTQITQHCSLEDMNRRVLHGYRSV